MVGILHLFDHDFLHFLLFLWINGEVEFVVYLDNHLALDALRLETIEDAHHRHLDDVRLRTLDRGVDGIALGKSTYSSVSTADVWQVAAAMEDGFGIPLLTGDFLLLLHISLHAREGAEVILDNLLRLLVLDIHALG